MVWLEGRIPAASLLNVRFRPAPTFCTPPMGGDPAGLWAQAPQTKRAPPGTPCSLGLIFQVLEVVEATGLEPVTSGMPCQRSPS